MTAQMQALYVAKHADGSWNFTWSTKLQVLTWDRDENGVTGYVQDPGQVATATAYLVPAGDVVIAETGNSPAQYFMLYVSAT